MNDQQIHVLIAKTPGIRAVQIADALDKPLADVSQALGALVEVGDVVRSKGFAPNGHPAQLYDLSDDFKKSKDYKAVLAIVEAQPPTPAALSPVAARPAPAPVVTPVFLPVDQPTSSRADLGIAYVRKHLSVTQDALRTAMGLKRGEYPSNFLKAAIGNGKLHKDGDFWKVGVAAKNQLPDSVITAPPENPAPAAAPRPAADPIKSEVVRDVFVSARSAAALDTVVAAIAAAPVSTVPMFRCGLWSDGVLELQRNGSTVAVLEQKEGEQLAGFINRMLLDPLGAAVHTSAQQAG
jgi:hypothetical protein